MNLEPDKILNDWGPMTPGKRRLVDTFLSPAGSGRRFALGRNEHSAALMKAIEVDGIIDDYAEPGTVWNGRPMVKGTQVPAEGITVNCSLSISPVSAGRRLGGLDTAGVLSLADLCRACPDRFPLPQFVRETREDLEQNPAQWKRLADSLEDAESQQVLEDVIRFRVTGDPAAMQGYSVRLRDQYFEEFLHLGPGEVFVDAGGYDGDTTEEFCKRCPEYGEVFLFEPSAANLQKARSRLKDLRDIHFFEMGLSDVPGEVSFDADAGSASAVSDAGSCRISMTTLDSVVRAEVSFIKMDLEGWELKALDGSRRHILEDRPNLAVGVYHRPSDFWRVFNFVRVLRSDCRVRLRHYTEGWSETVMYFCS